MKCIGTNNHNEPNIFIDVKKRPNLVTDISLLEYKNKKRQSGIKKLAVGLKKPYALKAPREEVKSNSSIINDDFNFF